MSKTKRNGKIEFARFIFAVIVMLFHIGRLALPANWRAFGIFTPFKNGAFGVEFFFVVSGYLMAASAFKAYDSKLPIGKETFLFLSKKLMAILPIHLIAFIPIFIFSFYHYYENFEQATKFVLGSIPNFLLILRSGLLSQDVLNLEWYIGQMLLAMFILYPLCKKYYEVFTRIIAPIASLMIIGYLIQTFGSLGGNKVWSVLVSKTFLRAIAEICAGAFAFELCRNIKKLNFSTRQRVCLTVFEALLYLSVFYYTASELPGAYSGTFFVLISIAVTLSFSNVTYGSRLFNNKFFYWLGGLSLPIYMCHGLTLTISNFYFTEYSPLARIFIFLGMTAAFVALSIPLEKLLRKSINKTIEKLKPEHS